MNSSLITEIKPSTNAPLCGFWYPACLSSEFAPGSLKGTMLLGLPILACKTSQGAVAAMRNKPAGRLIDAADTSAKWYYQLNAAHFASAQTGQPLDHPLKERVTLRWKSYAQ